MHQEKSIAEQNFASKDFVLIVAIVEPDFAEHASKAAKVKGAEACTVIHGRGKYVGKKESVFNVPLDVSRDLVLAVVHKDKASEVQDNIFEEVGLKTEGHGLVYQLPINSIIGFACEQTDEMMELELGGPPGHCDKRGKG